MVSVIIVNFNSGQQLKGALDALSSARQCEVIVVDNASSDEASREAREAHPWVRWVALEKNVGFGAANNIGAQRARGEVLLLLNPDALLHARDVATALELTHQDREVGALGFRQVDAEGNWQLSVGLRPSFGAELVRKVVQGSLDKGEHGPGRLLDRLLVRRTRVSWVAGSAIAVRRDVYERVGGFDERFFLYFEDIDFCLRIGSQVGPVVYEPGLTLMHIRGVSAARDPAAAREHYRRSQALFWSIYGRGRLSGEFMERYARYRLHHNP